MEKNIIRIKREILGMSQAALGKIVGVSQQHIDRYEKGYPVPLDKVSIISKTLKLNKWDLLPKEFRPTEISSINKVGFVEAGIWQEACQLPEDEWEEIPYPVNDNLKDKRIFALGVHGNSMNKKFPPNNTTLICCCIYDYPLEIENGDYVIAQRVNASGKYECTVKKYTKLEDGTVILEAESTDPRYTNIIVNGNAEYSINAVVIDYITKLKNI